MITRPLEVSAPADPDGRLLRRASWRLGLQAGVIVALIVAVLSALAVLVVVQGQHRGAASLLAQAVARADDVTDPPAGVWLVARTPQGRAATPGLPPGLPDEAAFANTAATGQDNTADYRAGGVEYRVHTVRRGQQTIQAALDLSPAHAERVRLASALLLSGGLGLVLAAAAGAWLGRRAVRPMAQALALQRRFVADAGHELRTPLTLLSTRVQLLDRHLRRGTAHAELRDEAAGVAGDARHLAAILDDLLLAAEPGSPLPSSTVDLAELAERAAAASANDAIPVEVRRPGAPVPVRGSAVALRRAVTALLDNASSHARTGVTISVSSAARHAALEVTDDGPGIDAELLPGVFERFATARGRQQPRGYGIGLALVSEIAARHGGTVSASNQPGGGARLRLTLPRAASQEFSKEQPPSSRG
ncbi:signal transduction histidine kinase [Saccharomonospora amisosensis]|uniref:histidine kinase n=1 Tax=Saccharomonospora amisosensis TaxID=1128677 RepID=A0A7X5ZRK7_9PSEU|nr:sensor histidine kinase [Saccharomonospora amisosensis]NIJ12460.1 signal transduction histidine kinase [Saccharomonospora amisosensis]